ncbi:hypothetical protein GAYE_HPEPCTG121G0140 [Galdieria yellowstonensis]|uniref:Transducin family protein / WD-40 repeat family protein n=1 Tax=Galdieria yellowstonensis TaxID=3028027 RepID=A0AAV9I7T4_9RHOD|nr:hypothetical protein GAYE_HPEPCTG121G0140 [Galdieria yellowstonensis]
MESEESQTVNGFSTNESPFVYDDSFDSHKHVPSGIGFEKPLFLSNRIVLTSTEKRTWITALLSCVASNEEYIGLLVQSRWVLVGWNNGRICLVDIPSGQLLAEFYSEQVQSAVCCLAHGTKSSCLFASGHVNGDIWLWSWQPYDDASLLSMKTKHNNKENTDWHPFSIGDANVKELRGCYFKRNPLIRIIDSGMEFRNWIRFSNTFDNCVLLRNTKNKLQFFTIREQPLHPLVNTEQGSFHISTTILPIEDSYGEILDGILTNTCIISCGQDDTIRIFQRIDSFPTKDSLLPPPCVLYQHNSYVTCLEIVCLRDMSIR